MHTHVKIFFLLWLGWGSPLIAQDTIKIRLANHHYVTRQAKEVFLGYLRSLRYYSLGEHTKQHVIQAFFSSPKSPVMDDGDQGGLPIDIGPYLDRIKQKGLPNKTYKISRNKPYLYYTINNQDTSYFAQTLIIRSDDAVRYVTFRAELGEKSNLLHSLKIYKIQGMLSRKGKMVLPSMEKDSIGIWMNNLENAIASRPIDLTTAVVNKQKLLHDPGIKGHPKEKEYNVLSQRLRDILTNNTINRIEELFVGEYEKNQEIIKRYQEIIKRNQDTIRQKDKTIDDLRFRLLACSGHDSTEAKKKMKEMYDELVEGIENKNTDLLFRRLIPGEKFLLQNDFKDTMRRGKMQKMFKDTTANKSKTKIVSFYAYVFRKVDISNPITQGRSVPGKRTYFYKFVPYKCIVKRGRLRIRSVKRKKVINEHNEGNFTCKERLTFHIYAKNVKYKYE